MSAPLSQTRTSRAAVDDPKEKGEPKPAVLRDEKGRLLPGAKLYVSSPGRPMSLAKYIGQQTNNGETIVTKMIGIWEGREPGFKAREKLEAGKWLADRYWGKAIDIQAIAHLDPDSERGAALRSLASDALLRLAEALNGKQLPPSTATIESSGTSAVATVDLPPKGEPPP